MSKVYKVELTDAAHEDLEDIVRYISNKLLESEIVISFIPCPLISC